MVVLLQVAGVVAALIGAVALYYGIPVKEFSFGNTLILAGAISLCTGTILLALSVIASELRTVARRLGSSRPAQEARPNNDLPPFPPPPGDDQPLLRDPASRGRESVPSAEPPPLPESPPAPIPRRNLLFSSSMRKDRERASRPGDLVQGSGPAVPEPGGPPLPGLEDSWLRPERTNGDIPQRRFGRPPAGSNPGAAPGEPPGVTVLKSGIVDGMAYSLYSDGSIEAQMPEGMMRFASIDELREHLDHRS